MKVFLILLLIIVPIIYSMNTKNPQGTNVRGEFYDANNLEFFYDLSYLQNGETKREKRIFNKEMELIKNAEEFLLLDIFLYNDDYTKTDVDYSNQVEEMSNLLIKKKRKNPSMPIILITDPINNFYGAYEQVHFTRLKEAGVEVVVTDLNKLKDSNPLVSGFYRAYLQWFGTGGGGWIRNFFDKDGPKVNIRSIIKLANFKGNHRKVYISEKEAIIASANPHDPSSNHSNVAVKFSGKSVEDLIETELVFLENPPEIIKNWKAESEGSSKDKIRIITEMGIFDSLKEQIESTKEGDKIWVGIFYISDFDILKLLGEASNRNVEVKIIADLNKDAFGLEKNGTPNRPALTELKEDYPNIKVRFYNTSGEQFHTKMAYFDFSDKNPVAILGSGNFTRRNLKNLNLETNVELDLTRDSNINKDINNYFKRIWENVDGDYTTDLSYHEEHSIFLRTIWKIQEATGLCTW